MTADLDPSAPLCLCGVRGCELLELHTQAFIVPRRASRGRGGKQQRNGRSDGRKRR